MSATAELLVVFCKQDEVVIWKLGRVSLSSVLWKPGDALCVSVCVCVRYFSLCFNTSAYSVLVCFLFVTDDVAAVDDVVKEWMTSKAHHSRSRRITWFSVQSSAASTSTYR